MTRHGLHRNEESVVRIREGRDGQMMTRENRTVCVAWWIAAIAVASLGIGCADGPPADQMNSPPQGEGATDSRLGEYYVAMTDNALLNDASMSSTHFVPRTAELNALGVRRLTRCAEILKVYGGKVVYDGTEEEQDLRKDRIERIRSFLVSCGLSSAQFQVEQGMAGGAGMDAEEAGSIRKATRGPGDVKIQSQATSDSTAQSSSPK
jgi:hypothetical protein